MSYLRKNLDNILLWMITLAPSVLLRLYPAVPLASDEKVFAVVSRQVAQGAVLYRDVFDHKGPALYWLYNLCTMLTGGSYVGIRIVTIISCVLMQVSVFFVARKLTKSDMAAYGSALAIGIGAWLTNRIFQVEIWMAAPLAAALALLVCRPDRLSAIAAGVLTGFAIMIKPTVVLDFAVLLLLAYAMPGAKRRPDVAIAFVIGTVAAGAAFIAPFVQTHSMRDLIEVLLTFNSYYTRSIPMTPELAKELAMWLARQAGICCFLWLPASLMLIVKPDDAERRAWTRIMLLWTALGIAASLLGRRPLNHYLLQAYLPMSILVGIWIANWSPGKVMFSRRSLALATTVWLAAVGIGGYFHATKFRADLVQYAGAEKQIAAAVDDLTTPNDSVLVWGNATNIYYFSHRKSATRYIFYPPFHGEYGPNSPKFEQSYWTDWMRRFDDSKPSIVVDCSETRWNDLPWLDPFRNPELAQRLRKDYMLVERENGFRIYKRLILRTAALN
jgi:4-amino-4-deoxy-L-arabinose transferase-like glycosyltransferase